MTEALWKNHSVVRPPLRLGPAWQVLGVAAPWREARRRLVWGILAFMGRLCLVGGASAAGGLLWEDLVDKAGSAAGVNALAVGSATNAAGNRDFTVRTYEAKGGALL